MKLAGRQIPSFLERPDPSVVAVLVYGPDGGLVRERLQALAGTVVEDLADPFRVAELPASELANDPARLSDEAAAIALTGGRRVVMVRGAGDGQADALRGVLDAPKGDALILVEGGDLGSRSALRGLFEKAKNAAALPCYRDEPQQIEALVDTTLGEAGLSVSAEARAYLAANLGADRGLSRRELEKLILYKGADGAVSLEDAEASVGDSAALNLDDVAFAVAAGDLAALERSLTKTLLEGSNPVAALRAVARHYQRLQRAAAACEQGKSVKQAIESLRPRVFFRRRPAFQDHLAKWPLGRIGAALEILTDGELGCKSTGVPGEMVCRATLLRLAALAQQSGRF